MENTKLPAYPCEVSWEGNQLQQGHQTGSVLSQQYGFTKLEKAALMIAQGLVGPDDYQLATVNDKASLIAHKTAQTAVLLAKAVLEEANK